MVTKYENYSHLTLYVGPFTGSSGEFAPSASNVNVTFYKDGNEIVIQHRITPYRNKVFKVEFDTRGLAEGYYSFEAIATVGSINGVVKGNFELSWIDQEEYLVTQLRYSLFDIWGMHHLDVWDEGTYWNDMQLRLAFKMALSAMNSYGGQLGTVTLNNAGDTEQGILLVGGIAFALDMRDIYEVSEAHNYTDEVTFNISRNYGAIAAKWKANFDMMLQQALRRPLPIALKSPMFYSEITRFILSLPPYSTTIWR